MPPTAQRTIYLRRADAESGYLDGGQEANKAGRGRSGSNAEETATGASSAFSGRFGGENGEDTADGGQTGEQDQKVKAIPKHHARNWGRERSSKARPLERATSDQAKQLMREEPNVSTIGIYTLIGPAPIEPLEAQTADGVVSRFSSMEVPTATGFTTLTTATSESHARFTYDPITSVEAHHTTLKGPPAAPNTTTSVSHGERQIENSLPASYIAAFYGIMAFLSVMWVAAVVLYFVNFPPEFLLSRKAKRKGRMLDYKEALEVNGAEGVTEQIIGSAAFTTSSETPFLATPGLRPRRQVSEEYKQTSAVGLGIELSNLAPRRQRSFIHSTTKALQDPPRSASLPRTAPLPSRQWDDVPAITHASTQELEDGLPSTAVGNNFDSTYLSPRRVSPYDSPSGSASSSRSASPHRVLKKVGDGIEYITGKAVRLMHDQVKDDPEEDLYLPVQDSEREQTGDERKLR